MKGLFIFLVIICMIFFIAKLVLNVLYITLLLVMIFSKRLALKLERFVVKILELIHYKKLDFFKEKMSKQIDESGDRLRRASNGQIQ